jgi:hypothetical protein
MQDEQSAGGHEENGIGIDGVVHRPERQVFPPDCFVIENKVVTLQLKIKLGNVMTFIPSILLVVDAVRAWGSRACGIGVRSILPPP